MRKNTIILVIIAIALSTSLKAQKFAPVEDVAMIQEHENFLKREYPQAFDGITIEEVLKIDEKHSVIAYESEGEKYEVLLNSGRKDMLLVATYHRLSKEEMPNVVVDQAAKEKGWSPEAYYEVEEPHSEMYYAIQLTKGEDTKRLYYNHLGQFKQSPH